MRIQTEPTSVVETDAVNHQRVSLPASNRVTHPGRVWILRMPAPVQKNLPVSDHISEQLKQQRGRLRNLIAAMSGERSGIGKAMRGRIAGLFLLALSDDLHRPRQKDRLLGNGI